MIITLVSVIVFVILVAVSKGDELLYRDGGLMTGGLPFAELKARSLIDTRARAANDSPDFSKLIRVGLPGVAQPEVAQ